LSIAVDIQSIESVCLTSRYSFELYVIVG